MVNHFHNVRDSALHRGSSRLCVPGAIGVRGSASAQLQLAPLTMWCATRSGQLARVVRSTDRESLWLLFEVDERAKERRCVSRKRDAHSRETLRECSLLFRQPRRLLQISDYQPRGFVDERCKRFVRETLGMVHDCCMRQRLDGCHASKRASSSRRVSCRWHRRTVSSRFRPCLIRRNSSSALFKKAKPTSREDTHINPTSRL
jgi:hypothetical protein